MDKLTKVHHSLTDWRFEAGHEYYLNNAIKVTAPTSLCAPLGAPAQEYYYCYLKQALGKNVPIGKFETFYRNDGFLNNWYIHFRQQPPLVHLGNQNGYSVVILPPIRKWRLLRYVGGVGGVIHTGDIPAINTGTWYKYRIYWYEYIAAPFETVLRVKVEHWDRSEWVDCGHYDDTDNLFADSEDNRVGFALRGQAVGREQFLDNTDIWGAA